MGYMEVTRLYIARHGQVVNHHEFRFNGHFDVDITDKGVAQMERLGEFLSEEGIDFIYSSDLKRASRGARIIADMLGMDFKEIEGFRELSLGRWEGLTMEEVKELYPEEAVLRFKDLARYRVEGGENLVDLSMRVNPVIDQILDTHRGKNILIVGHGGVNRAILCRFLNLPLEEFFRIEQDYGCLNVIDCFDGYGVVKLINGGPNQGLNRTDIY